ncbi:septal ring lytic transglycosylase RlpA family protein [Ferruginibacter profundus]
MKPFLNNKTFLLVLFTAAALFFLKPAVLAQRSDPAKAIPTAKSKRILYGLASFYSNKFNGRKTASGEIFSQHKLTCACNVLPLGTWIRVTNLRNGRTVVVKTNDRLHPRMKRIIDLTSAAATKLGYTATGLTRVKVEVLGKKPPKND